ncbi:hypothetical protein [Legionella tunisiensis]|uniref:hypothetical protein n=1 Tax=Legionella tunisiensis TaxID=1034944 RepID=UPI00031BC183|nr:hypothetical protein [Legionella tunisiensis]
MKIISMPKFVRIMLLGLALCWMFNAKANELNKVPSNLSLPQRGYWLLLNKPFAPPLLNEDEYDSLWTVWPEPLKSQAEKASKNERRIMALKRYGFQESPDRTKGDIPQQFTRDSKNNLSINCLACHGGKVAGTVILGLGNSHINFATFNEDLALLFAKSNRKIKPAPKILPPEAPDPVRGVNNAWAGAVLYMLVRDDNLHLTPDKLQFPQPSHRSLNIPMDTPAFWNVHHKKIFIMMDLSKNHIETSCSLFSIFLFLPKLSITGITILNLYLPGLIHYDLPSILGKLIWNSRKKVRRFFALSAPSVMVNMVIKDIILND